MTSMHTHTQHMSVEYCTAAVAIIVIIIIYIRELLLSHYPDGWRLSQSEK